MVSKWLMPCPQSSLGTMNYLKDGRSGTLISLSMALKENLKQYKKGEEPYAGLYLLLLLSSYMIDKSRGLQSFYFLPSLLKWFFFIVSQIVK